MPATFAGFPKSMFSFFRGLEKNNDRDWFNPRKQTFEDDVRAPMIELVGLVNQGLRAFAADHLVDPPAKAIYRIYRDTRFSNDKTPYKTHIGATFHRQGLPRHGGAGFYFSASHKEVEIAGGVYMPGPDELTTLRNAIASDPKTFVKLVTDPKITRPMGKLQGMASVRLPKGFESHADSPAAPFIKMKQWYWYVLLDAKLAASDAIRKTVLSHFQKMTPTIDWMNNALLAARKTDEKDATPSRPAPMW